MNQQTDQLFVSKEFENERIDKFLASCFPDQSRSYFQYLIEKNCIQINGQSVKKRTKVKENDEVEIFFIALPELDAKPENIPLDILYEDEWLIIVNKPAGMVVHPAPGHYNNTFVNALLYHCQEVKKISQDHRPGIVHRLDKNTSGILIAAKTIECHQKLIELFSSRQVHKEYLAIVYGNIPSQTVETGIQRHKIDRKKMTVRSDGKIAISKFKNLSFNQNFSLVNVHILTGRTHQIRVHCNYLKHPILGDEIYGSTTINGKYHAKRQMLHAYKICFNHPIKNSKIELTCPPPADFQSYLKKFEIELSL